MIGRNILKLGLVLAFAITGAVAQDDIASSNLPDVPYVPTSHAKVEAMLKLGEVKSTDILYDLGSGDGRIPITAAKKYGARGVGIDINAALVNEAIKNAKAAKVSHKVKFKNQDLFKTDFREATVVTLYLLSHVNLRLRPILWEQLRPGTRVVSHAFSMGDWEPEKTINVEGSTLYLWRIPTKEEQEKMKLTNRVVTPPKATILAAPAIDAASVD